MRTIIALVLLAMPVAVLAQDRRPDNHRSLCWQDYCPCVRDRDYGGADPAICRMLRAGQRVSAEQMAAAAAARDARRQIREFGSF